MKVNVLNTNFLIFIAIYTAAVEMLSGSGDAKQLSRNPEIMADAAYAILSRSAKRCTGQFLVDDNVLHEEGISDLTQYAADPSKLFL